jgi:hypothetical protein
MRCTEGRHHTPFGISSLHTLKSSFSQIHFNIVFQFVPLSLKRSFPSGFFTKILYPLLIFHHAPYMSRPSIALHCIPNYPWFYKLNRYRKIWKLWSTHYVTFFPNFGYFFCLTPKVSCIVLFTNIDNMRFSELWETKRRARLKASNATVLHLNR